jgi:hypothetical protein
VTRKSKTKAKSRQTFNQLALGLNLPAPPNNPYQFSIDANCDDPDIEATLTPDGGILSFEGMVVPGTDPIEVTFPPVPDGDYSLSVTVTCGTDQVTVTQDVTLTSGLEKRKRKPK